MAVEALRDAAVGQGEAQRAAEGLAVEAAFGMGPEAEAADDLVGVQRSPLTSARGEGAALSGARQGRRLAMRVQMRQRAVGQAEVLLRPRSRACVRFRRPVSRSTRRRSSLAILSGRSPEGSSCSAGDIGAAEELDHVVVGQPEVAARRPRRRAASGCTPAPPAWPAASSSSR